MLATMAVFLPPVALIPLHGVVQLGSNVGRTALMRRHVLYKVLPHFAVGTVAGSAIGANMFVALPVGGIVYFLTDPGAREVAGQLLADLGMLTDPE